MPQDTPAAGPLADLREPDAAGLPGATVPANSQPVVEDVYQEVVTELRPMVTAEMHEQMVDEVLAAWHADPTSLGFLHSGGGLCGCRYIARHALQTAVPVMTDEDMEEHELKPSEVPS